MKWNLKIWSKEIFFLCEYIEGKFGTGDGPEFNNDPKYKDSGEYLPEIIKEDKIEKIIITSRWNKRKICRRFKNKKNIKPWQFKINMKESKQKRKEDKNEKNSVDLK